MSQTSIAEAKTQLTRLIYQVERGEAVHITRRGKPVRRAVVRGRVQAPAPRAEAIQLLGPGQRDAVRSGIRARRLVPGGNRLLA